MNEFKYEIGNIVVIDSDLQRYVDIDADIRAGDLEPVEKFNIKKDVIDEMVRYAGMTATITGKYDKYYIGYKLDIDDGIWNWHQDLLHSVATRDSIDNML